MFFKTSYIFYQDRDPKVSLTFSKHLPAAMHPDYNKKKVFNS